MKNEVQLITYADSLGGDLKSLSLVLNKYLKGRIGGVHILPFYSSSFDREFLPRTLSVIAPVFGDWKDIKQISKK